MDNEEKNREDIQSSDNRTDEIEESNAAKLLRMRGISVEEPEPEEPVKKASWIENFWYHHKFAVLSVAFFVLIVVVGAVQLFNKVTPDIYVMYSGPAVIDATVNQEMNDAFGNIMNDCNNDGKLAVRIMSSVYYTAGEKETIINTAKSQNLDYIFNEEYNNDQKENFTSELMAGNSIVCFLSEGAYEEVKDLGIFIPLEEYLSDIPGYAMDEYALYFKETEFAKYFPAFDSIPDNTVMVLRDTSLVANYDGRDADEVMREHQTFVRKLISYTPPEEE